MSNGSSQEKLKILKGEGQGSSFQYNTTVIEVGFNPTEYSIKKSNSFNEVKVPGLSSPIIQFNTGETRTLSLEVLFDTFFSESTTKESVKDKYIDKLEKLMAIDSDLHAPPPCKVIWGKLEFEGILDSMDKKYTLFDKGGTPLRARVNLSFKEFVPLKKQLKSSPTNSPDRRKLFTIKEGDNIWLLANRAYGDPGLWRVIADANHIDNPLELESEIGRDLIIPELPG
jgi:hypothetical protein